MKKTLISLAVAATVFPAGLALASTWKEGSNGGEVNIGGSIKADNKVEWLWLIGGGSLDFANTVSQMGNGGTTLTMTAPKDIPLLAMKLAKGITGNDLLTSGTIPKVTFLSRGEKVTPVFGEKGGVALTVKTYGAGNTALGTVKINARAAGSVAVSDGTNFSTYGMWAKNSTSVMDGAISGAGSSKNDIYTGVASSAIVTKFGGPTLASLEQQVRVVTNSPNAVFTDKDNVWSISRDDEGDMKMAGYGISYGLGIEQGAKLEATFLSPVTKTTSWVAPITISIAYN